MLYANALKGLYQRDFKNIVITEKAGMFGTDEQKRGWWQTDRITKKQWKEFEAGQKKDETLAEKHLRKSGLMSPEIEKSQSADEDLQKKVVKTIVTTVTRMTAQMVILRRQQQQNKKR